MKRYLLLFLLFPAFATQSALAQAIPVWSTDIAPIINNNCVSCHRTGGIAPFSLATYQELCNASVSVKSSVESKHMPPWPPDPTYKRLAHERMLSQSDINKISSWITNGTPQGDPNLAPPTPVFSNAGDLPGTPDLEVQIPNYTSTAVNGDVYQCFVVPSGLLADRFITAFEAIPGNRGIVHHVLVYADTTGTCANLDAQSPGPGYTNFGGPGTDDAILLGAWVPGTQPMQFPSGFGLMLPKNSDIVIQVHYPAGSAGQIDFTKVRFFFSPTNNIRNILIMPVLNHSTSLVNGPLFIPANTTKTFVEQYSVPGFTVSLLGVAPHMHLIGKNISCFVKAPNGDTQNLIRINDWHFHWQGFYMFRKLEKVLPNSELYAHAFYDNTANNHDNPHNPPIDVALGEGTADEMMLVYFIFTFYQPGDENIVIDPSTPVELGINNNTAYYRGQQLLEPYPNPAHKILYAKMHFDKADHGTLYLLDMQGRIVKEYFKDEKINDGYSVKDLSTDGIAAGTYILKLTTTERALTQKVVIE